MLLGVENEQQSHTHTQLPLGFPVPERQEWGDDEHDDMTSHLLACFTLWEF